MKNLIVAQSGGPTSVINGSLYGVISEGVRSKKFNKIYGAINGIEGLLKENIVDLKEFYESKEFELLKGTPSSYLGSCRYKLSNDINDEQYKKIFEIFKRYEIGYFFYIGGNDSMDTVSKIAEYAEKNNEETKVIGIPKTIDNDLCITDHTPGYGSASKFIGTVIKELACDNGVYETKSVIIVEIMGRHTGWLTASAALANLDLEFEQLIYLPEIYFSDEKFISDVKKKLEKSNNLIVAVSEGIKYENDVFVCENEESVIKDSFGHRALSGSGKVLEQLIKENLNVKVRSIELSLLQRCGVSLGSRTDLDEAILLGESAVKFGLEGKTGEMVCIKRGDNEYNTSIFSVKAKEVCNKEKFFPKEWLDDEKTGVTKEFIKYVMPLVQGDINISKEKGMPVFATRKI